MRMNIGCLRRTVQEALEKLSQAAATLHSPVRRYSAAE